MAYIKSIKSQSMSSFENKFCYSSLWHIPQMPLANDHAFVQVLISKLSWLQETKCNFWYSNEDSRWNELEQWIRISPSLSFPLASLSILFCMIISYYIWYIVSIIYVCVCTCYVFQHSHIKRFVCITILVLSILLLIPVWWRWCALWPALVKRLTE